MKTAISKSPSYLTLKGGIYYFRVSVPDPLRPVIGKTEIKKSLKTGWIRQARTKAGRLAVIINSLFDTLQQGEIGFMADLTTSQIHRIADKWLKEVLEDTELYLLKRKPTDIEKAKDTEETLSLELHALKESLYCNDLKSLEPVADEILEGEQLTATKNSLEYLGLLRELRIRQIQSLESEIRYRQGEPNWKPEKAVVAKGAREDIAHSVKVSAVVEEYIQERLRMGEWQTKSELNNPPVLRDFIELIGDPYIENVNRELIQRYKRDTAKLPKYAKQDKLYKDKTLEEILKMDIPEDRRLAPKTISNRYRITRTFLNWAYSNGYNIEERCINILKNTGKKSTGQPERAAFTVDELHRLFHSSEYVEDTFKKSFHFWVPILGLFTGARIEEICQLHLDDFIEEDGLWCFDFNKVGDKNIKTAAGIRKVPIHPFLLEELNIIGYVQILRAEGKERFFPELSNNTKAGKYSDKVSKWFTRYRREKGVEEVKGEGKKAFHCFRNTFISRCYDMSLPEDKIMDIVGHSHGNVTAGTYRARPSVKILYRDVISKVSFDIDLSHLRKSTYVVPK